MLNGVIHHLRRYQLVYSMAGAVLLLFLWLPVVATAEEVGEDEYWALLAETQQMAADGEIGRGLRNELANDWEEVTAVRLGDGTVVPLDTSEIATVLRDPESDLSAAAERWEVTLALRGEWPIGGWAGGAADEAKQQLLVILQDDEFLEAEPNALQALWQQFWERVDEIVSNILPNRGGDGLVGMRGLGTVIAIIAGVMILIVLIAVASGLLSDFVAEADYEAEWDSAGERFTAATALQEAQKLSAGGDLRTAVRYLYLSSLLSLEERGLLRYDRSLTNREYLRSVAHRPELFVVLQDVVEVFDKVWYGFMPIDQETYQQFAERVAALQTQRVAQVAGESAE